MARFADFTEDECAALRVALGRVVDSLDPDEDPEFAVLVDRCEGLIVELEDR